MQLVIGLGAGLQLCNMNKSETTVQKGLEKIQRRLLTVLLLAQSLLGLHPPGLELAALLLQLGHPGLELYHLANHGAAFSKFAGRLLG